MKIRELYIEDYKMFKDFKIDFVDKDDNPLPIIVLAGTNGSGKTTLLESLYINSIPNQKKIIYNISNKIIDIALYLNYDDYLASLLDADFTEEFEKKKISLDDDNLIYISVYKDTIKDIKETIRQQYIDRAFEIDKPSEALKELQNYIAKIFYGLDLSFNLSSINYNKNIVLFKDSNGIEFDIEALSTGEKTLLSKVLYLYFKDYKDKVILIDEPELSLHPSWQNRVLKIYENFAKLNNCQIIIATHSPHIIASADNKYIRFLEKEEDGNVTVINDVQAYGRDIEWVLEQMGVKNLRVSEVLEKFTHCQELLNNEKYDEAEECINSLEEDIGKNDRQVMSLRNSLFFERD